MGIYRGYDIKQTMPSKEYIICGSSVYDSFKTVEEAMNKIDSIERERIQLENEHIKLTDSIK